MSPLLSNKSKRADSKLVGVHLPLPTYNKIAVYVLAKAIPKSQFFEELINNKIEQFENEKTLLNKITERYWKAWKTRKKKKPRSKFDEFIHLLNRELQDKGLTSVQIRYITKGLRDENERDFN